MASTGNPVSGPTKTYVADGVITAGCAVMFSTVTAGRIVQVSAANAPSIGIADIPGTAGTPVRVTRAGDTPATAGGVITAGQYVKTDASGKLVAVTGTAGDGENIVGRAESAAAASGDNFVLFVNPSVL